MRFCRVVGPGSAIATIAAGLAMSAPAGAASGQSMVQIRGTKAPAAARTPRVGSVAGNTAIDFSVVMKLPDQAALDSFTQAVSTPDNPQYRNYLTPAQWEQRFSPTQAQVDQVTSFLSSHGLQVKSVTPDRLQIEASGDAAHIESTFDTSLSVHRVQGQDLRLADANFSVPSDLAGVVSGVVGVSMSIAHRDSTTDVPAAPGTQAAAPGTQAAAPGAQAAAPAAQPDASGPIPQPPGFRVAPPCGTYYGQRIDTTLPPFGQGFPPDPPWAVCGYTPPQMRSAYNLNGPTDGTGVTVAIVDAYESPTLLSDLQTYASLNDPAHRVPASQFTAMAANSFNHINLCDASGWFGEQSLDVEAVHASAPGAHILYMGARNCLTNALNRQLERVVDGHLADVVSNSYGDDGGDVLDDPSDRIATDDILEMAAGTGVSVLFSSGDDGDEFTTIGLVAADYPASSPWATAVGGTSLAIGKNGQRTNEYGWSTARSFLCNQAFVAAGGCDSSQLNQWLPIDLALDGGSGGGTSFVYPQPFYQKGVVPQALSTANAGLTAPDGTVLGHQPMRVEPDISMDADPATGFLEGETQTFPDGVYYDQYRIGGTSLSSPLFAGVIARADQLSGRSAGFVNPALYGLFGNPAAVQDVVPAGKVDQSRADFANSIDPSDGFFYSTRIIDYEGPEQFCDSDNVCTTRKVALKVRPGYDNMTGIGVPTNGFVRALAH